MDWFVESPQLATFVKKTKKLLSELQSIAEFDSNVSVGAKNLVEKNLDLNNDTDQIREKDLFRSIECGETTKK